MRHVANLRESLLHRGRNCGDGLGCIGGCSHHVLSIGSATWSLWAGVDLRTVQQWLGHSDMESTMRYLKPSRSQAVHAKVNDIFA